MEATKQIDQSISGLSGLFKFNDQLFYEKIGNLSDDQALDRVSASANPIIWIAGHLTNSRVHVLELLGVKNEHEWAQLFKDGYDQEIDYPKLSTLKDVWKQTSEEIFPRLDRLTEEELNQDIGYDLPHGVKALRGGLVFWLYHEAWHLGQISYIRKCMELEGLVPY